MKGLAQPQTKKDVLAPPEANKRIEPTCNPENDREIIFGRGCLQHNRRHRDDGCRRSVENRPVVVDSKPATKLVT
jgi:hypothetical protein